MTAKADVLQAIRQKCLDCSCFQPSEVRDCPLTACSLWPFRLGRDPEPSRTRGFAKPTVYTGHLSPDLPETYPDSGRPPTLDDSTVYTRDFTEVSRPHAESTSVTSGAA